MRAKNSLAAIVAVVIDGRSTAADQNSASVRAFAQSKVMAATWRLMPTALQVPLRAWRRRPIRR
jgi:hypothetical protein